MEVVDEVKPSLHAFIRLPCGALRLESMEVRIMRNKKTKKMLAVEERIGKTLEDYLPDVITAIGMSATAEQIGVSKASLGYWLLKLGIVVHRVALRPGESIKIERGK